MAERLYYTDSFLREFDARVLAATPAGAGTAGGAGFEVVLDRTAFYPASGGQPSDTGRLGPARVVEVVERADGEIVHLVDREIPRGAVRGEIDWERRFDHLQQHTAQHLLSAAFLALFDFPTVSFHLGRETSTIDLAAADLVPRHLDEAERRANQVIFEDRAVSVSFGTAEELADRGIRKAVEREGILRVVEIEGFDRQPCGGTHATRTGQVGLLLVRKAERQKGNWRVEFVAGGRALRAAREDYARLGEAAREIGCGRAEVPAMVLKAFEERQAGRRDRQRLLERLAELEARALAAQPETAIVRLIEEPDPGYLRLLAAKLVAGPGMRVALANRAGHVVLAQSAGQGRDLGALLREILAPLGGKGGGPKDFAQGTLPDVSRAEEALARARERLA
jgi:alanyl-tRNA synthetase